VFSILHEIGPIITGLVVSGRVGAGIAAELASMKVTGQIDAIEASAVNPYELLAATRILACTVMLPLLTPAADLCGLVLGWVALTLVEPISLHQFIGNGFKGAGFNDGCARVSGRDQLRTLGMNKRADAASDGGWGTVQNLPPKPQPLAGREK
jgi:ABC-type transporter Mla maintaining outer membrane lipid asymmetry permease subunit MlaE